MTTASESWKDGGLLVEYYPVAPAGLKCAPCCAVTKHHGFEVAVPEGGVEPVRFYTCSGCARTIRK